MKRPVVEKLIRLMEFRNSFPAFDGSFAMKECEDGKTYHCERKQRLYGGAGGGLRGEEVYDIHHSAPEVRGRSWINKAFAGSDWLLSAIVYIECV